jgi:ATP-dependent helicase HrpB
MDLIQELERTNPGRPHGDGVRWGVVRRIEKVARNLKRALKINPHDGRRAPLGELAAWAYPDRIAKTRSGGGGRYQLANGRGAVLDPQEPLAGEAFIVAVELDGDRQDARIFRAAAYDRPTLERQYKGRLGTVESIAWDVGGKAVKAVEQRTFGALILDQRPIKSPDPERVLKALVSGIRQTGAACLPWSKKTRQWQARACFMGRMADAHESWPDFSDEGLLRDLESWLAPFLTGMTRLADLAPMDLQVALASRLTWDQQRWLKNWAPTHLTVPSGSKIPIDYGGHRPVLAVRLQEMFGLTDNPAIADGRQPLLIHLLSPAGRPVQITEDLGGFWTGSYIEVKKELQGRYPKHYWPEDPLTAVPTRRAKPRKFPKDGR